MANPYAKYVNQQGGGIYQLPPSPQQAAQTQSTLAGIGNDAARLQLDRERLQLERQRQAAQERKDAAGLAPQRPTPEQMAAVRAEAQMKLNKLNGLIDRSKNNWFATGAGTNMNMLGIGRDVPGSNAYDQNADVQTVSSAGALTKVMEMAAANGGKNPLTPLSEGDFANIAKSITNLDIGQSDDQFQKNAGEYRDIYRRALKGAGGFDATALRPEDADKALENGYRGLIRQMQGRSTAERQDMLRRFEADDRIQTLRRMAPSFNSGLRPPPRRAAAPQGWKIERVDD